MKCVLRLLPPAALLGMAILAACGGESPPGEDVDVAQAGLTASLLTEARTARARVERAKMQNAVLSPAEIADLLTPIRNASLAIYDAVDSSEESSHVSESLGDRALAVEGARVAIALAEELGIPLAFDASALDEPCDTPEECVARFFPDVDMAASDTGSDYTFGWYMCQTGATVASAGCIGGCEAATGGVGTPICLAGCAAMFNLMWKKCDEWHNYY